MADLLRQGAEFLDEQRHAHMTQTVTYRRGASEAQIAATIGRSEFEDLDEFGVIKRIQTRDYLMRPADLVLNGSVVTPLAGDQIEETDGTSTWTYQVMPIGNAPGWRYSDPHRTTIRIHTKLVQTQTS